MALSDLYKSLVFRHTYNFECKPKSYVLFSYLIRAHSSAVLAM